MSKSIAEQLGPEWKPWGANGAYLGGPGELVVFVESTLVGFAAIMAGTSVCGATPREAVENLLKAMRARCDEVEASIVEFKWRRSPGWESALEQEADHGYLILVVSQDGPAWTSHVADRRLAFGEDWFHRGDHTSEGDAKAKAEAAAREWLAKGGGR